MPKPKKMMQKNETICSWPCCCCCFFFFFETRWNNYCFFFAFLQYLPVLFVALQMLNWFFFGVFASILKQITLFCPLFYFTVTIILSLSLLAIALLFVSLSFSLCMCFCFLHSSQSTCVHDPLFTKSMWASYFVEQLQLPTGTCIFPLGALWTLLTKMQLSWTQFIVFPNKKQSGATRFYKNINTQCLLTNEHVGMLHVTVWLLTKKKFRTKNFSID